MWIFFATFIQKSRSTDCEQKFSSWNSSSFVNFIVKVINFISGSFFYSNQKFSYQVFKKWDAMMKSITLYAKLKINFKNMRNNHKT